MSPIDRAHIRHGLYYNSILYRFRVMASYLSNVANFNLPHLHTAPPFGVTPFEFAEIFGFRKLQSLGYRAALLA